MSKAFPGFGSPAAGFDEPLDMLAACHERIEAQLGILDRLPGHLTVRGADEEARSAAGRVLRYFDDAGPKHHADEESDLFPLLEARGALRELIALLREDHRGMALSYAALRPMLQAVATGKAGMWQEQIASRFSALYRNHIVRENAELLPAAGKLLDGTDRSSLAATMIARRSHHS
jgi:hemerythrin-like domain-containing protein